jgi:hypothetical protein
MRSCQRSMCSLPKPARSNKRCEYAVPTLRELQRSFAAAVFADDGEPLNADVRACGVDARARLGIYRRQLHATFARTLALEFPVIERLVGAEYFQRLSSEFQAVHPSRSGNLHHIGAPFAAFLKQRFRGGPYDYFADVAELEWTIEECSIAPEAPAFDLHALRSVAPARYADLHFEFHPACRLMSSAYPLLDIWRANQSDCTAEKIIDLGSGATRVLVQRSGKAVEFHALSPAEFAFLEKLWQGCCLGTALEAAHGIDAAFDLGAALRRCVALHALTAARLTRTSSNDAA